MLFSLYLQDLVGCVDVGGCCPWTSNYKFGLGCGSNSPGHSDAQLGDNHCIKDRKPESVTLWVFHGSSGQEKRVELFCFQKNKW